MDLMLRSVAKSQVFVASVSPYLLLDRDLSIVDANQAYLSATDRDREELLGSNMFDAFPDNPADPFADGVHNLRASLEQVLTHGATHVMQLQRYDIPARSGSGEFVHRVWSPANAAMLNDSGRVVGALHHVEDVTPVVDELALDTGAEPATSLRSLAVGAARYRDARALLAEENLRLKQALLGLAASRRPASTPREVSRRTELWQLITDQALSTGCDSWSEAVCRVAVDVLDTIAGAAITVHGADGWHEAFAASDARTSYVEDIQYRLHEGPAVTAWVTGLPVLVPDIRAEVARWPHYVLAAADTGLFSVAALLLRHVVSRLGTLTLYGMDAESRPAQSQWADTRLLADLSVSALLADLEGSGWASSGGPVRATLGERTAAIAADMLARTRGIDFDDALRRIRNHALRAGVPLREAARDVVLLRLPVD